MKTDYERKSGFLLFNYKDYYMVSEVNDDRVMRFEVARELITKQKWPCSPWDLYYSWVLLLKTDDQADIDKAFDFAYEQYNKTQDNLFVSVVIYCKSIWGKTFSVPEKYKNIEFISLYQSDEEPEINLLEKLFGERMTRDSKKSTDYFQNPNLYLKKLHLDGNVEVLQNSNKFLLDFYRNAIAFKSPQRSVMALLDYCELVITLSSIYCIGNMEPQKRPSEKDFIGYNLMKYASVIKNEAMKEAAWNGIINSKIQIPDIISQSLTELHEYVYIKFTGEKVSFMGLVSLLLVVRNKIIAHGIMTEDNDVFLDTILSRKGNAYIVWKVLFWITDCLNEFLRLDILNFEEKNGAFWVGYEKKNSAGKLMIVKEEFPLIASKINDKGRITYVNYFNGEMIIPEYVRV